MWHCGVQCCFCNVLSVRIYKKTCGLAWAPHYTEDSELNAAALCFLKPHLEAAVMILKDGCSRKQQKLAALLEKLIKWLLYLSPLLPFPPPPTSIRLSTPPLWKDVDYSLSLLCSALHCLALTAKPFHLHSLRVPACLDTHTHTESACLVLSCREQQCSAVWHVSLQEGSIYHLSTFILSIFFSYTLVFCSLL